MDLDKIIKFVPKIGAKKFYSLLIFSAGIMSVLLSDLLLVGTSSNEFCASCHVHPQASQSWKLGPHYDNSAGVVVDCVDCHLPPGGIEYLRAKAATGFRDIYGMLFKDESEFNWENKSSREAAAGHTYEVSCIKCHQNLFPRTLNKKGEDAHLYYESKSDEIRCINCHLETGHYHDKKFRVEYFIDDNKRGEIYSRPADVREFESFTEMIPASNVSFNMVAVTGGEFTLGTPEDEDFREEEEGPQKRIKISSFWIGETEVSWDEYLLFIKETGVQGRTEDQLGAEVIDGVSGPTPPYGNPDQGWGGGKRPAITMTHFAALKYCEWLSLKTGKKYRLPTEAEWEYACRAGTETPYYFDGTPGQYSENGFINSLFGADTSVINSFSIYRLNSGGGTGLPEEVRPNPLGIKNMIGNVKEFCSDWYSSAYYNSISDGETDPKGPESGKERVVRGGSFKDDASQLRSGARDFTKREKWLTTDPQIPKSIWWYSDCNDVGFRVVCETDNNYLNK